MNETKVQTRDKVSHLIIGGDYTSCFPVPCDENGKYKGSMTYNGGISWTATMEGKSPMTRDSQKMTDETSSNCGNTSSCMVTTKDY